MNITASEIYRMQRIIDNLQNIITISDKGLRSNFHPDDYKSINNLLENTTLEFYLINESINERI